MMSIVNRNFLSALFGLLHHLTFFRMFQDAHYLLTGITGMTDVRLKWSLCKHCLYLTRVFFFFCSFVWKKWIVLERPNVAWNISFFPLQFLVSAFFYLQSWYPFSLLDFRVRPLEYWLGPRRLRPYTIYVQMVNFRRPRAAWQFQTAVLFPAVKQRISAMMKSWKEQVTSSPERQEAIGGLQLSYRRSAPV